MTFASSLTGLNFEAASVYRFDERRIGTLQALLRVGSTGHFYVIRDH